VPPLQQLFGPAVRSALSRPVAVPGA